MSVTANGWPALEKYTGAQFIAAGEGGAHDVANDDVAVLAAWSVYRIHTEIEPVEACSGARTRAEQERTNRLALDSNHVSGTAWDVNGGKHPYEAGMSGPWYSGFTDAGLAVLRDILAECDVLQWGGDFDEPWRDGMHFQIRQANLAGNGPRIVSAKDAKDAAEKIARKVKRIQRSVGATVDGYAGPGLLKAVKEWQKAHDLEPDGVFGPKSQREAGWHKAPKFPLPDGHAYAVDDGTKRTHSGARKADEKAVEQIQSKLGCRPDGQFGKVTAGHVKAFQRKHDLAVDGEVGPTTWRRLFK